MKKILKLSFVALACALLTVSCNKAGNDITPDNLKDENPAGKVVTISARLSEALTKVAFTPDVDGASKAILKLTWEDTDKLIVADHANPSTTAEFTLVSGNGTAEATFRGTLPAGATSYDVSIKNSGAVEYNTIQQAADNDASHLEYIAAKKDITDLDSVEFDEICGVLGITAKLPAGVAATVRTVSIVASENIFNSGKTLTIELETAKDEGDDDILRLYAPLPVTSQAITAGTTLLIRFNNRYTRFITLGGSTLTPGTLNEIKVNCSHTDQYAGGNGTSADNAYLIGDPYQLAAINSYASQTSMTYFKMIDDVNMSSIAHTPINEDVDGYSIVVDFNGKGKTISNLGKDLFYVLKGSVYDLTLDKSNVSTRGILAEYIQGTGNIVSNVTVSNGKVNSSSSNVGGLVGNINSTGISATITNCTVSDTDVTGAGVVGGVIGFADAVVTISGCIYKGGTVTSTARFCGGMLGSTGNYASVISDCHVEDAIVSASIANNDYRTGGFVGQLQTSCTVKGCSVGTASKPVTITLSAPTSGKVYNAGGFVGVNYGTITKNGEVNSKAYAQITSANTLGQQLNLGGFVGFGRGTIEYCDAIVDMKSLKGQYIGGFAGYVIQAGTKIENCTVDGDITGNNYTGGFAGYVDSGAPEISNCSASGTVSAQSGCGGFVGQTMTGIYKNCSTAMTCTFTGSNNGGFVGQIHGGTMTGCSSNGSVTATGGSTYGGFVGLITNNGATLDKCSSGSNVTDSYGQYNGGFAGIIEKGTSLIKRCYATGDITSDKGNAAGFIGSINHASNTINVTVQDCYSTGNIINSNQIRGGFIAQVGTVTSATITNCYATGEVVGSFRLGGLIGNVGSANITVEHCAAWNSEVTASSVGPGNWSSGAVVGTAFPTCTLTDNYRKPDMSVKSFWGNVTGYTYELTSSFNHDNVSSATPLKDFNGAAMGDTAMASGQAHYPWYPYHGKVEAGKTLSQLASTTLGWSSEIWDFTGDLPTLR